MSPEFVELGIVSPEFRGIRRIRYCVPGIPSVPGIPRYGVYYGGAMQSDLTKVAAWWGAVIATGVFLWDIYKWWRAGANLRIKVLSDAFAFGAGAGKPQGPYIVVTVTNVGDAPTTIQSLSGSIYRNKWQRFFRKPIQSLLFVNPSIGQQCPYKLLPGEQWKHSVDQSRLVKDHGEGTFLLCQVSHTMKKKPVTIGVQLKNSDPLSPP